MSIYHSDLEDGQPVYADQSVIFHNEIKIGSVSSFIVGAITKHTNPDKPYAASVTIQFYKNGGSDGLNLMYDRYATRDEAVDAVRKFETLQVSAVRP